MIISRQEKSLAIITVVILLYGVLFMVYGKKRAEFDSLRQQKTEKDRLYAEYCNLISQHETWENAYSKDANLMPVFEPDRQVETYWLGVLDRIAQKNNLSIIRRQALDERQEGDVYELPIECKEWEGTLENLTKFLYDVHAEGAMLDIRKIFIRPGTSSNGKPAAGLRGSFTITCAYLRSEADDGTDEGTDEGTEEEAEEETGEESDDEADDEDADAGEEEDEKPSSGKHHR